MHYSWCMPSHASKSCNFAWIMHSYHHLHFADTSWYVYIFTSQPRAGWFSAHPPLFAVLGLFYCVSVHPLAPIFNLMPRFGSYPQKGGFSVLALLGIPMNALRFTKTSYLNISHWLQVLACQFDQHSCATSFGSSSMSWASLPYTHGPKLLLACQARLMDDDLQRNITRAALRLGRAKDARPTQAHKPWGSSLAVSHRQTWPLQSSCGIGITCLSHCWIFLMQSPEVMLKWKEFLQQSAITNFSIFIYHRQLMCACSFVLAFYQGVYHKFC